MHFVIYWSTAQNIKNDWFKRKRRVKIKKRGRCFDKIKKNKGKWRKYNNCPWFRPWSKRGRKLDNKKTNF